jgi:DNA primase
LVFEKIPIVDTARRCGLVLDSRTLRRREVEASCPFCGDHGKGKYHLSLNTVTDQFRCNLCGARGNSVTLYAQLNGVSNKQAFQELRRGTNVYPIPKQPTSQNTKTERQPVSLEERHAAYTAMLGHLTLLDRHHENLLERGLSEERIIRNQYRSMPETEQDRRLLASLLRSCGFDLLGVPGFRTCYSNWTLAGPNGFLIPVRDKNGLIQGLKIRLDDDDDDRKYRWLSSRDMTNGTRSYSWVHVTGDTTSKRAYLTEGFLKGVVASFLRRSSGGSWMDWTMVVSRLFRKLVCRLWSE